MTATATPPPSRARRAVTAGAWALAAGATVGLADAVRCRLDPASVVPPSLSAVVVVLYAALALPAGLAVGALLSRTVAAATVLAGALAVGLGLFANYFWLPAFTDPVSIFGDTLVLGAAALAGLGAERLFRRRGVPGARAALGLAAAAVFVGALLAVGGGRDDGPRPRVERSAAGVPPDVLVVVIDTLRADAPGWSGAPGAAATPHLDALAAGGTIFTRCRATSSWTKPSTASLLTGLWATQHGALRFESVLPGDAVTLAELLRAGGWRTAAFADNPFIAPEYGFAQGFEGFTGRRPSPLGRGTLLLRAFGQLRLRLAGGAAFSFGPGVDLGADRLVEDTRAFLLDPAAKRPAFAYLHLIEPHYPYTPPAPFDGGRPRVDPPHSSGILPFDSFPTLPPDQVAAMRANYHGEVSAADAALGRLFDALREAGRLDDMLIVVTSDHGEEFHEHGGWTHGQSLYDELVRVPLLVKFPGPGTGRRSDLATSLVDVVPTVLARLDLSVGEGLRGYLSGHDLGPVVRGEAIDPDDPLWTRPCIAELEAGPVAARALFSGPWVLNVARKGDAEVAELFDLEADPEQRTDLLRGAGADEAALKVGYLMLRTLDGYVAALRASALEREERPMDTDTKEALRAIGYTGGDGETEGD